MKKLLLVVLIAACSAEPTDPGECENTLTLRSADDGSTHEIDDGCTSLIVSLANETSVVRDAVPTVDPTVLRFDYRYDGVDGAEYYFTPLRSGTSLVQIGAVPTTSSWNATIEISLP